MVKNKTSTLYHSFFDLETSLRKDGIFFMAKKSKKGLTASGKYRHQIAYYDDSGNRKVKSFTADTLDEARVAAFQWKKSHNNDERKPIITVAAAVQKYIDMKRNVLSPSTMRNYVRIHDNHIENNSIGSIHIDKLTNTDVQIWISTLSEIHSPKTVRNIFTLFKSSIEMFMPDIRFRITLPAKIKTDLRCPNDEDIRKLLSLMREKYGSGSDMEICLYLAAFGTLRRGECAALHSDDIEGNVIHINKCMVEDEYDCWTIKTTKTYSSTRAVELPQFVVDMIKDKKGRIVHYNPDQITSHFRRCVEASGIEYIRFHDLRHYSASIMHAIGVPDQYIMDRGGWSSDNVMKAVYRNVIDIEKARQTVKINNYFKDNFG